MARGRGRTSEGDVTVTSSQLRRAVLGHAVLSFAYNTTVLALALNLVFGRLGGCQVLPDRRSLEAQRYPAPGRPGRHS
jgi:hypothetical protein